MPVLPPPEPDRPTRAQAAFGECLRLTRGQPRLAALHDALAAARERLGQPLRVAIAGQASRGKSTLVNAMIDRDEVAVGRGETTSVVTELSYAPAPAVTVRYEDGAAVRGRPEDLHRLTVRDRGGAHPAPGVARVEYGVPSEFLKSFRLLDTPGLASVYEEDGTATEDALGLRSHRDSESALLAADALVFLIDSEVHEEDFALVERFAEKTPGKVTPVFAIGVYAKCDMHWRPGLPEADPLEQMRQVSGSRHAVPQLSRYFFDMVAVAAVAAHGAARLTPESVAGLRALAKADPVELAGRLRSGRRFVDGADFAPEVPAAVRLDLYESLQPWGLYRACRFLAAHPEAGAAALRAHLREISGVDGLNAKLARHFGNRAAFIKLHSGLHRVRRAVAAAKSGAERAELAILELVERKLNELEFEDSSLDELNALAAFYAGDLGFTEAEREEILRVTGEYGTRCEQRLGRGADTPLPELERLAVERGDYWSRQCEGASLPGRARHVARIIRNSYWRILHRIRQAQSLLDIKE
ncbi:50S ribosome-binding GTPase [Glycomyces sambucus]|uniref:50S ribosome-binding GTPase n=1 Tax=Glycomyces sambucus TaxID=380244 RepID=A0A1G9D1T6_9ACTN|nr:dynamin family protein [Glycomyces sambucus]SDK57773.1 50S ribosome-binding GTPase [Glycomyces sambucus]